MIEVEKKLSLQGVSKQRFFEFIRTTGIGFSESMVERDLYFRPRGFRQRVQSKSDYLVRVRTRGGITSLNLKKLTNTAGVLIEHETEVRDEAATRVIIEELGAEFACSVAKARRYASYDGIDLLLDEVDGLGLFLEISIEVHDQSQAAAALQKIDTLISLFQDDPSGVEIRGYPDIILQNEGVRYE